VFACPSESALVAFVEQVGGAEERARIAAHLDHCEVCRTAVALAVGTMT